jgi:hypothetical protein
VAAGSIGPSVKMKLIIKKLTSASKFALLRYRVNHLSRMASVLAL